MLWWQVVYGKRVESPGGPVVAGSEHGVTGRTPGLPDAAARHCHPSQLGIGSDDLTDWGQYPWKDEGGVVVRAVEAEGARYLLVGRVRPIPEGGRAAGRRLFLQAHYLVTLLDGVTDADVGSVWTALKADPMPRGAPFDLPRLELPTPRDVSLPDGWLDRVAPYLEVLASGHAVADVGADRDPLMFFRTALICLACLPAAVRQRVPFGCGLYNVLPEQVALGHGLYARGVHRSGEQWIERDRVDLAAGRAYMDWLRDTHPRGGSLAELRKWVDARFPALSTWNTTALKRSAPWQESVKRLSRELTEPRELAAWERWLAQPAGPRPTTPLNHFTGLRPLALLAILHHLRPGSETVSLLEDTLEPSWADAWQQAQTLHPGCAFAQDLPTSVALLSPFRAEAVAAVLPLGLSEPVEGRVRKALERELARGVSEAQLSGWAQLIRASADGPVWLRAWRKQFRSQLLWLGFRAAATARPDEGSLESWYTDPEVRTPARALACVLYGRLPDPVDTGALLDFVRQSAAAEVRTLRDVAWGKRLFALAIRVAASRSPGPPDDEWSSRLSRGLCTGSTRGPILADIARVAPSQGWPDELLELLLEWWEHLPTSIDRLRLGNQVRVLLGEGLAEILCGVEGGSRGGATDLLARECLTRAMNRSTEVVRRALEFVRRRPSHSLAVIVTQSVTDWVTGATGAVERLRQAMRGNEGEGTGFPSLMFLHELNRSHAEKVRPFDLSTDEAVLVTHLLRGRPELALRAPGEPARKVGELRALVAALAPDVALPAFVEDVHCKTLHAALINDQEQVFWDRQLRRLKQHDLPGWRLLCLRPARSWVQWGWSWVRPERLTEEERQLIGRSSAPARLRLLLLGWPWEPGAIPTATVADFEKAGVGANDSEPARDLRKLLRIAERAKAKPLGECLFRFIVHWLGNNPRRYPVGGDPHGGYLDKLLDRLTGVKPQGPHSKVAPSSRTRELLDLALRCLRLAGVKSPPEVTALFRQVWSQGWQP